MTQFNDQLRLGAAYWELQARWNGGGMAGFPLATAPQDSQVAGVPLTQAFVYQVGTASTALASGIFYSASGSTSTTGAMTATGPLVTASVATFDVPRGIRITASIDLSTTTFVVVGTDGYGQTQSHSILGPTGNTIGNIGSYRDSVTTFRTVTTISHTAQATAITTTLLMIGDNNQFGLPYRLNNVGGGLGIYVDGQPSLASGSATTAAAFTAAIATTVTPAATTADVRGYVTMSTTLLANDSRYITIAMVAPPVNRGIGTDDKISSYGPAPFAG